MSISNENTNSLVKKAKRLSHLSKEEWKGTAIESVLHENELGETSTYFHHPLLLAHLHQPTGQSEWTINNIPTETVTEVLEEPINDELVVKNEPIKSEAEIPTTAVALSELEEPDNDEWVIENEETKTSEEEEELPIKIPGIVEDNSTELVFTPYHTVDYFASQGIQLKNTEMSNDKFGTQLKSFTEWLKTLKKTPVSPQSLGDLNQPTDTKVTEMAAVSLSDNEIVTEAMAEIWLKQGQTNKAVEVYKKLSLQNPEKSAYFATLIDKFKNN